MGAHRAACRVGFGVKSEHAIQNDILRLCNRGPVRLWRINSGTAWQGREEWRLENGRRVLVLHEPTRVALAEKGTPDLYGFTVRDGVAVHTEIEVKGATGRQTKEQEARINHINDRGGIAFIARSVDNVLKTLFCSSFLLLL